MKISLRNLRRASSGFTLAEMLIATGIGSVVVAGTLTLYISFLRSYNTTTLMRNTSARASFVLERMVYGVGTNDGLREAKAVSVNVTYPTNGWQISYNTNYFFRYVVSSQTIKDQANKTICTNVISSTLTNNTAGCQISVTVAESGGGRISTNSMSTFVQYRN